MNETHPLNNACIALLAVATSAALTVASLSGCSTMSTGMGDGQVVGPGQASTSMLFSWQSQDGGITGTLVATLPDASYQGPFMQITQDTTSDAAAPMWLGWNLGWNDWAWGNPMIGPVDDWSGFSRTYSGKVVANLRGFGSQAMRCRFDLAQPSTGMSGGGQGECQMSDGRHVDAVIQSK